MSDIIYFFEKLCEQIRNNPNYVNQNTSEVNNLLNKLQNELNVYYSSSIGINPITDLLPPKEIVEQIYDGILGDPRKNILIIVSLLNDLLYLIHVNEHSSENINITYLLKRRIMSCLNNINNKMVVVNVIMRVQGKIHFNDMNWVLDLARDRGNQDLNNLVYSLYFPNID